METMLTVAIIAAIGVALCAVLVGLSGSRSGSSGGRVRRRYQRSSGRDDWDDAEECGFPPDMF